MTALNKLFPIFMILILMGCQASGGGSSDLISHHVQTTNKFTLQTPAAKTYIAGETLTLSVSFPFDITADTTGGPPRLKLTVGATTRYATYSAQADLRKLVFTYTFASGENDTDGVVVNALELNGSTLTFLNNTVVTNCDVTTLTTSTLSQIKVDTAAPTISDFKLTNIPGLYNVGETLSFTMTFSENVYVTGTPKFVMTLATGGAVDVTYLAGSGSTLLAFSYTVKATDADTNGLTFTSPLSGGTIKDAVGNDSSLDFSAYVAAAQTYSANVHVQGQLPYIVSTTFPANGTYSAAQDLDFILNFDKAVTITGSPYLDVTIGANTRQAAYVSGSGTTAIKFRYTAVPGDVDADGIVVAASISQNGSTIVLTSTPAISFFADALNNYYVVPNTAGILLNAVQPQATSLARNLDSTIPVWGGTTADNIWISGQDLNFTVGFNTQMFVDQANGTPSLSITIGASTRQATYLSGGNGQTALVFRYTIQDGDLDTDGTIAINALVLNGGVIRDAANTNSLVTLPVASIANTKVDGVRPTISSVTAPSAGTYSQVAPLDASAMNFSVNWSEAVNYSSTSAGTAYIGLDVGGSPVNADYSSGNNTPTILHRPSTLANKNDSDGIAIPTGTLAGVVVVKDQAGNTANVKTFTAPSTTSILVDTTVPTITSMTALTANGTYKLNDTIDFQVIFSEPVTVSVSGGYPQIPLTVGGTTRYLTPTSSQTSTTHTYRYTIVANETDTDGVTVTGTHAVNATGTAQDAGRNSVASTFTAPSTPGIKVDSAGPAVAGISKTANGTYESGTLQISVQYNEAVTVTGTPRIAIPLMNGTVYLNYVSGTGTTTINFSYTLTTTDYDFDGLPTVVNTISLNGGTMADTNGNAAATTFTNQDMSGILVVYPGMRLWTTNTFVSKAPAGSPAISNSGVITTEACGTGTCRTFNGDDALNLTGSLTGVTTVFIVFKTPAAVTTDKDIFYVDVTLAQDTTVYDLRTANSTLTLNGGAPQTGVNFNVNMATGSTNILSVDYTSTQNYSAVTLVGTAFTGAIGEVMAFTSTLTATQKTNIYNYLDGKY